MNEFVSVRLTNFHCSHTSLIPLAAGCRRRSRYPQTNLPVVTVPDTWKHAKNLGSGVAEASRSSCERTDGALRSVSSFFESHITIWDYEDRIVANGVSRVGRHFKATQDVIPFILDVLGSST